MSFTYKKIISWLIVSSILIGLVVFVILYFSNGKSIKVLWPGDKEVLRASETYQIKWEAKKIEKVGILLVKGEDSKETKWIARDIPAKNKEYNWQVFIWEKTGQDYRIAILEYPWQEGKPVAYSDFFTIIGPEFASCDYLSIEKEWPYVSSDFPDLRKIFITSASFTGDLGGLEGADKKCQEEAEAKNFDGTWKAFLGDDLTFALDRLEFDGIFVQAEVAGTLPEEKTCHRLLGRNFEKLFKQWSEPFSLETEKLEKSLLADLSNIWLGRVSKESSRDCLYIPAQSSPDDLSRSYSFTTSCQNWSTAREIVAGYPPLADQKAEFPICYTPEGVRVNAAGLAGLASSLTDEGVFTGSLAKPCNLKQKLLCLEQ